MEVYAESYGLAVMSDGATVHHTPLINVLVATNGVTGLLNIVNCEGYMAQGGKKDGAFISTEVKDSLKTLLNGLLQNTFLCIFDGASNMVRAGNILSSGAPHLTTVHCALHVVHLILGKIAQTTDAPLFLRARRVVGRKRRPFCALSLGIH